MDASGIIDGNKVYTVNAFCRELGFKRNSSLHQELKRAGLKPILGKYIRGADFIHLLGQIRDDNEIGHQKIQNESLRSA